MRERWMLKKLFRHLQWFDSISSFGSWIWWVILLLTGLSSATAMGWASAQWHSFWTTVGWFGVGCVFLGTWFVVGLGLNYYKRLAPLGAGRDASVNHPALVSEVAKRAPLSSKYLKSAFIYGGSQNPNVRPWFSATFAKKGTKARIYLDHSHFIGQWNIGWTGRKRIFLTEVIDYVPDQSIRVEIMSEYQTQASKLWRWGNEEKEPPNGDYAFIQQSMHHGRVVVYCDDAPPEYTYFVILQQPDDSSEPYFPRLVGAWLFDFVAEWEAEDEKQT
jgi:hypothetical protein